MIHYSSSIPPQGGDLPCKEKENEKRGERKGGKTEKEGGREEGGENEMKFYRQKYVLLSYMYIYGHVYTVKMTLFL